MKPIKDGVQVLFVGAFISPKAAGVTGGVQFECRSLIESPISQGIVWDLLDTTMESIPPPPLTRRFLLAFRRVVTFCYRILRRRPDCCLIYASSGASFCEKGLMVIVASILGVPAILRPVSGAIVDDYRRAGLWRLWIRWVVRSASVVACQGRRWCEFYRSVAGLTEERTPVVYNPVDAQRYREVSRIEASSPDRALLVGWIEHNKGIWDLLEVVRRFKVELGGMKFVICGNGVEFAQFKSKIVEEGLEGFFDLRGWVDFEGKISALSECAIYLMLSHREGLPNALLEAMASGRAVIATAVGAVPDLVIEARTGFLCEARDVEDIGARIMELRVRPDIRAALSIGARKAIDESVAYEVVCRRWRDLINRVSKRL